jgi:hypothetical protein
VLGNLRGNPDAIVHFPLLRNDEFNPCARWGKKWPGDLGGPARENAKMSHANQGLKAPSGRQRL